MLYPKCTITPLTYGELVLLFLLLSNISSAASLDRIDVGGVWGTPGATNPTAIWWNPARLARTPGTQILLEGAPIFATISHERYNPDYGTIDPEHAVDIDGDGIPDLEYDYSGTDEITFNGVVPFVGISSDLGIPGFGIGAGLYAPFAIGGKTSKDMGPARFALRDGNIQAVYTTLAAGYSPVDWLSFGISGSHVMSTWHVDVDTESYTALADELATNESAALLGGGQGVIPESYQDGYMEAPGYSLNLLFDPLQTQTFTFGGGFDIVPNNQWAVSMAYHQGIRLEHSGGVEMRFRCPPDGDGASTLGAAFVGLCTIPDGEDERVGAVAQARSRINYNLPGRLQGGVVWTPDPALRIEAMGGYVFWHVFTDYEIHTKVTDGDKYFDALLDGGAAETAELVSQDRLWARDSQDAFWVGIDGKGEVAPWMTLAGRLMVDSPAVPTEALSANNIDAWTIAGTLALIAHPTHASTKKTRLDVGLSYTRSQWLTRENTESVFGLTVDPEQRKANRYFYPESNGTYGGNINRFGLSVRTTFGPAPTTGA